MSNFWSRTITGLSMVFILLAAIWFSGWVFAVIFLGITILGLREFYGLVESETCHPQKLYRVLAGVVIYLTAALTQLVPGDGFSGNIWFAFLSFLVPVSFFFFSFILEIYRNKPNPLVNIAMTTLGFLYIAIPFTLMLYFLKARVPLFYGMPVILVGYFAFTWINDTGAYLYGRQFGRHKFFERISPKKTWEGTIAGALLTFASAFILHLLAPALPLYHWLTLSMLVVVFGTHGDLAESLIKRSLNIKDSGTILPGHGGILDRFDTMLISAPFVFLYLFLTHLI